MHQGHPKVTLKCPVEASRPDSPHFLMVFSKARIPSFLQGRRPRGGIIPGKNAGILFGDSTAEGRREDGAISPFVGVPWGPPRPPKEVLKIRGGHQSSRELESLHFNGVPWPHRRGQKSSKKVVVKLTTFLKKAVFKITWKYRKKYVNIFIWKYKLVVSTISSRIIASFGYD